MALWAAAAAAMLPRSEDVQQFLLLLGALATFLLFAPRGLVVGLTVLVVLFTRLPQRLIWRCCGRVRHPFRTPTRRRIWGDSIDAAEHGDSVSGVPSQGSPSVLDEAIHDVGGGGDWGPSLVLVFEARDPVTGRQRLRIPQPAEADDGLGFTTDILELGPPGNPDKLDCAEILERLADAGLEYRLGPSRGGEYIFCVVRLPELTARANLSFYPLDLELEPARAWRYAAEKGMPLATRVRRKKQLRRAVSFKGGREVRFFNPVQMSTNLLSLVEQEGIDMRVWQDLHIRFVPSIPSALFRHFALVPGSRPVSLSGYGSVASMATPVSKGARTPKDEGSSSEGEGHILKRDDRSGYLSLDAPVHRLPRMSRDSDMTSPPLASPVATTILPPSMRLRLLLSLVADDLPGALGDQGPGLKLDQWRKPKVWNFLLRTCRNFDMDSTHLVQQLESHGRPDAFLLYFLMQDPRDKAWIRLCDKFGHPASPHFRRSLFLAVVEKELPGMLRSYFGQQIGFYFAFMQHLFGYGFALSVLLAPLLAVYSVQWAQHLMITLQKKEKIDITLVGEMVQRLASEVESSQAENSHWPLWSLLVGMATIIWGQCVIDSWRRQEQRLAKEWGTCRAHAGQTSRPLFRGRLALSRIDGRLTLVHHSYRWYQARVVGSNLAFLCLGLTFAGLVLLFSFLRLDARSSPSAWIGRWLFFSLWSLESQVSKEEYASLGAVYSVFTVLLYNLFKTLAHLLTEAENHKYEEHWEASVMVKKWMLTVIVQCWAVGHLLFMRPWLWPCAYGSSEVRKLLGTEGCAPSDYDCCDVELKRENEVLLTFAQMRNEEVVKHARQFVAGWLVSKIFVHNLLKWIVPRLFGLLCARGVYPMLPVDFIRDLVDDLTNAHGARRQRRVVMTKRCCCQRRRAQRKQAASRDAGPSFLPEDMTLACELQLDKHDPWDIVESANDLSVHFLVTSLTTVIYPFAPLLFLAHLLVEFQMDLYRLFDRRQPKPRPARGLPEVWIYIFQSYVYVGAVSNLAIVTWRTPLVMERLGEGNTGAHFAFFSTAMLLLVLVVSLLRLVVPPVPQEVKEHLQRQQEVEAFLTSVGGAKAHGASDRQQRRQVSEPNLNPRKQVSPPATVAPADRLLNWASEDAEVDKRWHEALKRR